MNDHDTPLPDALRWQLRALRQPREPERDLWPGIAVRLTPQAQAAAVRRRPQWPFALAATLAIAAAGAWFWRDAAPVATPALAEAPLQREADMLTLQYQAALRQLPPAEASAPPLREAMDELDRSASLIRGALQRDPDSPLLLQQLRRTYTQRLALAQRQVYS